MVNEEKVIYMTKMQIQEEHEKKLLEVASYSRRDYISKEIWIGFIYGTIIFLSILAIIGLGFGKKTLTIFQYLEVKELLVILGLAYLASIILYLMMVYNYAYDYYKKAAKVKKEYCNTLANLNNLYDLEEG